MMKKIIDLNEMKVQKYITENRPPAEIRDQLDLGYSNKDGKIELFEIRPIWDNPSEYQNLSFAKLRFIKSKKIWKLYWMRGSGKWELYDPLPESIYLEKLLNCIDADEYGCFKG